jgi:type I restriction enzyme S subunit
MNVSEEGRIDLGNLKFVPKAEADRDVRLLRCEDVLFNNTNSPELVGKTACYDLPEPRAFSNHMTRVRCHPEILDPHYCALVLHTKWMHGYFASICNNHVSQASISRTVLLETPLPLPPFAEQKRIVAKVEGLLARVSAAGQRLAKVPAILKQFRRAILVAACSGRLTADWRGVNGIDQSQEPDLPVGWRRSTLGDSFRLERGRFLARPRNDPRYYGGAYPFIQIGHLPADGGIIEHYSQTLNEAGLAVSRMFPKGTPLIAIVGATIGNTGVLGFDSCCPDSMVAVQGACDTENRFVEFYLRCQKTKIRDSSYASGGQPNINLQTLRPYPIDLPPHAEQHEIVRRVEALFRLADAIEKRVAAATARAEKLTQAVLAKAFRGELVPTEAELARREGRSYEPASALLDRIRAGRAAGSAPQLRPARRRKP